MYTQNNHADYTSDCQKGKVDIIATWDKYHTSYKMSRILMWIDPIARLIPCNKNPLYTIHRVPYFQDYKFHKWTKKAKSTLVSSLQSAIRVMIEFLLIFGETNSWKSPKSTKSAKFIALEIRHPTVVFYWTGDFKISSKFKSQRVGISTLCAHNIHNIYIPPAILIHTS